MLRDTWPTFSVVDQSLECGQTHIHEVVDHCVALEDGRVTRQVTKLLQCPDGLKAAGRKMADKARVTSLFLHSRVHWPTPTGHVEHHGFKNSFRGLGGPLNLFYIGTTHNNNNTIYLCSGRINSIALRRFNHNPCLPIHSVVIHQTIDAMQ